MCGTVFMGHIYFAKYHTMMIFVFDSKIIMSKNYLIAYGGRRGCEVLFLHYVPNVFHCFGSHLRRAVKDFGL